MTRFATLLLALGVTAACASSREDGPEVGHHPYYTVEGFCEAWARAACNDEVVDACVANATSTCLRAQNNFCVDVLQPPGRHDRDAAEECLEAVEEAYEDASLTPEEYGLVFRLPLASPCSDEDLRGESTTLPGEGEECQRDTDPCGSEDLVCAPTDGDASFYTCQPIVVRTGGQTCGASTQVCDENNYCEPADGVQLRYCIERPGVSGSCSEEVPCQVGLYCDPETNLCENSGERGDPCSVDAECSSGICLGAGDEEEGLCVDRVDLGPTDPVCENLR